MTMKNILTKILLLMVVLSLTAFAQNKFIVKTQLSNNNYEEERIFTITVLDNQKEIYKIKKQLIPHYSVPEVFIFRNGNLVLLHALEGVIEFYNSNGEILTQEKSLINKLYDEHKILYSKTNKKIALLISEKNKNKVIIFDNSGTQLSTFNIDDGIISGIVLAENENNLASSLYNWQENNVLAKTLIINLTANTTKEFPIRFEKGFFDSNNNSFVGFTNKKVFELDLKTNKIILNKKVGDNQIILDAQTNNSDIYFIKANLPKLVSGTWKYPSAKIIKIDKEGNVTTDKEISSQFTRINFKKDELEQLRKTNKLPYQLEIKSFFQKKESNYYFRP